MPDPIVVADYDPLWPARFRALATPIRDTLGGVAMRIDHIGSTAVPGLAAKPVIDMQISLASFEPLDIYRIPLERLGYRFRGDNPDLSKRYFREPDGQSRTHIHVRVSGSWSEQLGLLFRDHLRAHPDDADRYARIKRALAVRYRHDRSAYVEAKGPIIWAIMARAHEWSMAVGWTPGPSDV